VYIYVYIRHATSILDQAKKNKEKPEDTRREEKRKERNEIKC